MKEAMLQCPYCESELVIPEDGTAEKLQCPNCGGFFFLPGPDVGRPSRFQSVQCPSCHAEQLIPITAENLYYRTCSNCGKPFLFAPQMTFRCADRLPSKKWGEQRIGCPFCGKHYSMDYIPSDKLLVCGDCMNILAYPDCRPKMISEPAPVSAPLVPAPYPSRPAAEQRAFRVDVPSEGDGEFAPEPAIPRSAAETAAADFRTAAENTAEQNTVEVAYVTESAVPPKTPVASPRSAVPDGASGKPVKPKEESALATAGKLTASTALSVPRICGNILWMLLGGLLDSIWFLFCGLVQCITIIGIPFGLQMFKLSALVLCPFGADVYRKKQSDKVGCLSTGFNILWILCGGLWTSIIFFITGALFCITIIGIPFGLQYFKLGKLVLAPFGLEVRYAPGMKIIYAAAGVFLLIVIILRALL